MVVDHLRAVEEHLDVVADHLHRKVVPDTRSDLPVPSGEPDPATLDDVVQVHVVLEGVGARDVVVVLVLQPPDDSAALIALPRDRLALHRKAQVFQLRPGVRDRKPIIGLVAVSLGENVLAARSISYRLHDPLSRLALPR
ncbi:MAG: hypothetical protein E6J82_13370 [Deltaproteobacteria bacterium]|nr:MAG: hypothetical protein E6J82_13370 [Deltaproteobacteria bacterium]